MPSRGSPPLPSVGEGRGEGERVGAPHESTFAAVGLMPVTVTHPTKAVIHLDRLSHNVELLQGLVGSRPMWPAIKANAYGHGAGIVARHLIDLGYSTFCVAHVAEAAALLGAGLEAKFVILSAILPEQAEEAVALGLEPVVANREALEALDREARKAGTTISVHVKIDTGMARIGVAPGEAGEYLRHCRALSGVRVKGLMSHFARADEEDKKDAMAQIARFRTVAEAAREHGPLIRHMANSAAILDLPDSYFDAVRPGISIYGIAPSPAMANPALRQLRPVLDWTTRIVFLKEVAPGTGLGYGHTFRTERASLIATLPIGYGDGFPRNLSNKGVILLGGMRCPIVGRVSMDQSLVDVSALRGRVALGDEGVIIGRQGSEEITAVDIAERLGTIDYEILTRIGARVPRVASGT